MKNLIARDTEPIRSDAPLFLVGRNSRGNWVARDQKGLCGGLFVGRADAVKFAVWESGNRPEAVAVVPGVLELEMKGSGGRRTRPRRSKAALQRVA